MDTTYTVSEVAQKLNLSDKTLRRWEEAGRFSPSRTLGNQRRYSIEDIQILDAIKHGSIPDQADLLTKEAAARMAGVSELTIDRWEREGKIHPFITAGLTYYPKHRLMAKMSELKEKYVKPDDVILSQRTDPSQGTVPDRNSRVQLEKGSSADEGTVPHGNSLWHLDYRIWNVLLTIILLTSYHLFFNTSKEQVVSPQPGSVQGVQSPQDPRVDELIQKFEDYQASQMLKDAASPPITTINIDGSQLISGTVTMLKDQNQVSVTNPNITPSINITITPTSDFAPARKYWVTPSTGSFILTTDFPVGADATFHYFSLTAESTASPSATTP